MRPVLEVIPHPTGPWLVKVGTTRYAVPRRIGLALRPLAGGNPSRRQIEATLSGETPGAGGGHFVRGFDPWTRLLADALNPADGVGERPAAIRPAGRVIRFRIPLIPAAVVGRLARILAPLADVRGLAGLLLIGGAGCVTFLAEPGHSGFSPNLGSLDFGSLTVGLGLFFLSAVWHELGHAAALARAGYPPGGIGGGLLFVIPVLFADVSAVGVLGRRDRLRVDVAGVIFQFAVAGCLLAAGARANDPPALRLAAGSALLAVAWSLFPFVRSDGYWLVCDLLGLPDLDRPPARPPGPAPRLFLPLYQLANAAFLVWLGLFLPWRLSGLVAALLPHLPYHLDPAASRILPPLVGLAFMGLLGVGLVRRIRVLVRSAWAVARGS